VGCCGHCRGTGHGYNKKEWGCSRSITSTTRHTHKNLNLTHTNKHITATTMADPFDGLFGDLPAAARKEEPQQQQKRPAPTTTEDDEAHQKQQGEDTTTSPTGTKKRARQDDKDGKDNTAPATAATKPATLDLKEALQKITRALTSTKVEKSRKALALLIKLMTAEISAENADQFHAAIAFFMGADGTWDRVLGPAAEDRTQATELLLLVKERILLFGPEEQYRAATWILLGLLRAELLTDDTFEFRRAARSIKEYVVALQVMNEEETYADTERRKAILACLATALKQNLHSWAKPSIEDLFKAATERRLVFPEDEREELDEMSTKLRQTTRGLSVNPTGTVISRSVRMVNSMSTPFNRKKADIYR